jgi:hypothetical protein
MLLPDLNQGARHFPAPGEVLGTKLMMSFWGGLPAKKVRYRNSADPRYRLATFSTFSALSASMFRSVLFLWSGFFLSKMGAAGGS